MIRVGSLISCVILKLLSIFFTLSDDLSNQFLLKSPSKIISFLQEMELIVDIRRSKVSAREEGGLYMVPIIKLIFVKNYLNKNTLKM